MFSQASVILFTWGCVADPHGQTPLWADTPWADPLGGHPPGQAIPWLDTPWADTLPRADTPWAGTLPPPHRDGYCCGWYATYWNAFLLSISVTSEETEGVLLSCWLQQSTVANLGRGHPLCPKFFSISCSFYRPQHSCGKVLFLHLSLSHCFHRERAVCQTPP